MIGEGVNVARQGFTLVEVLAALAVTSVIILATAGLMHNVALTFDRGTNRVTEGERLVLAAERLAADIGAARFIVERGAEGGTAAFVGDPTKITFISSGSRSPGLPTDTAALAVDEVVSISVEPSDTATALVRRRGLWTGPHTPMVDVTLGDEVVLIAGQIDAAFAFARAMPEGGVSWSSNWSNEKTLPRLVKLTLRDRATGIDLLGGADFVIHADAPIGCAQAGIGPECITGKPAGGNGEEARQQQAQRSSP